jgi:hypothetical protein
MVEKSGAENTSQPEITMAEEVYIELCLSGSGDQKLMSDRMKAEFVRRGGKLEEPIVEKKKK